MPDYDTREAKKYGLWSGKGHGPSRNPFTGKYLKFPKHPTIDLAFKEDRKLGYRPIIKGNRVWSYKTDDPRLIAGPRARDLSAALPIPKKAKRTHRLLAKRKYGNQEKNK